MSIRFILTVQRTTTNPIVLSLLQIRHYPIFIVEVAAFQIENLSVFVDFGIDAYVFAPPRIVFVQRISYLDSILRRPYTNIGTKGIARVVSLHRSNIFPASCVTCPTWSVWHSPSVVNGEPSTRILSSAGTTPTVVNAAFALRSDRTGTGSVPTGVDGKSTAFRFAFVSGVAGTNPTSVHAALGDFHGLPWGVDYSN